MIPRGAEAHLRQALRQVRGVRGSLSRALDAVALSPEERTALETMRATARLQDEALVALLRGEQERRQREALAGRAA